MAQPPATVAPASVSKAAEDFYGLRREGIGHLEKAGSGRWTDYNTHDPGITILEAVAYAITDLAYRTGFPVADILASAAAGARFDDPYPGQALYSARTILTINPSTPDDFRRLLIDVDPVRNAWVRCRTCACDTVLFTWCDDGELTISHDPALADDDACLERVEPRGLYDVLLELESDATVGDLNDRKVVRRKTWTDAGGGLHTVTIEVRFPAWSLDRRDERRRLAGDVPSSQLVASNLTRTKAGTTSIDDETLRRHWFGVFYVDFEIELADQTKITIENASVRLFGDGATRALAEVDALVAALGDRSAEGFMSPYRQKLAAADQAIGVAKTVLEAHRNLDEDYCHVDLVEIEEIGVCADIEVEPGADIELVQAKIWFEIEQYLDPPIAFYSLGELVAQGEPIEAIFNGPELTNGFLTASGLEESELRTQLRVSDIVNRLMEIDGIIAIDNLQLTAYDADGNPIKGAADPTWDEGKPRFDKPDRISASWLLFLRAAHRPRLHRRLSRFLFSSNGLPFVPRTDEAEETLVQLHGESARPKIRAGDLDLPMPMGRSRQLESYYPVHYSFPLVYGIGPYGLPMTATPLRRAQAKQLKAYLMVFEQLLRNAYAQVAHAGELFSLSTEVEHTYFSAVFKTTEIDGYDDIVTGLDAKTLGSLVESPTEFLERRNRFLDHVMARFGEQFGDYAMLLTDLKGQRAAREELIDDKLAFLRVVPQISHDRSRAFNRRIAPCDPDNSPGLQRRVNLLLGLPDLVFSYRAESSPNAPGYTHTLEVVGPDGTVMTFTPPPNVEPALQALLAPPRQLGANGHQWRIDSAEGQLDLTTTDASGQSTVEPLLGPGAESDARRLAVELVAAQRAILTELILRDRYQPADNGAGHYWQIVDAQQNLIGESTKRFATRRAAEPFVELMTTWSAHKRAIVVEHLLLRPKFPGDALYPVCSEGPCHNCGDDPYSFRLTYVMPGWTAPFNTNMSLRRFADRTIQEQTPSHLLVKICWVGNDGFVPDPCDPIVDTLAELLAHEAQTVDGSALTPDEACECGAAIYEVYGAAFAAWFAERTLERPPPDVLRGALQSLFEAEISWAAIACAATIDGDLRATLQASLVAHFVEIALHGYQFERFEDAWCKWVDADAAINWTEERLQDTVIALLEAGLGDEGATWEALCACAATILATFGTQFAAWMDDNVADGTALGQFTNFNPDPVTLCGDLDFADAPGLAVAITALLRERYAGYTEASYRLRGVVTALSELSNTYPRATLHDCDEGSDRNPVRLGQTALGSN